MARGGGLARSGAGIRPCYGQCTPAGTAQGYGPGYHMRGWGGGYGPGMMSGYGYGPGHGHGMMGRSAKSHRSRTNSCPRF